MGGNRADGYVRELGASVAALRSPPSPAVLMHVVRTSAALWLLVRVAYVIVLMVAVAFFGLLPLDEAIRAAMLPTAFTRVVLVAVTAVLVWLDRRRAHEHLLQANFGVSPLWFWTASVLAAGVLDMAGHALLRLL